ncbi:MAG: bifunctional 2-polyprenyl-6-hydroxyphenol methylase/3-demethylubiquinol 3-O-methyltransferase UbiG [Methylocystis sp.]|nr:bifunctional 2-polyprenyl-6-hydroxyphenol methylase/3-demethylubiquinol 3-O-methyltransferase UbiG [Methylocystis sp.]
MSEQPTPQSASVNPEDVARFNRLGELWWDKKGKMGILHDINPIRVNYVRDHVRRLLLKDAGALNEPPERPLAGVAIADIGCGGGIFAEALAELGAKVTAIDPAPKNIVVAKNHAEKTGLSIDYRNITAEDLVATGEQFDAVTALEVIEHVEGPRDFIAMLGKLVKPGGLLFLATIDRTMKSYALAIVGAEYVLGWVPKGTHKHEKFIRPDELAGFCRAAGMREVDRAGMTYQPFKRSWRKSHDTDVNYLMTVKKET